MELPGTFRTFYRGRGGDTPEVEKVHGNLAPAHTDGNTRPKYVPSAETHLLPPRAPPRAVTPPRRPCASAASPALWPPPGRMPGSFYGTCSCGGETRLIQ